MVYERNGRGSLDEWVLVRRKRGLGLLVGRGKVYASDMTVWIGLGERHPFIVLCRER